MERLRKLFFVVLGLIAIGACEQEEIECLRVSGEVETQKRTVASFNKIFFNDVGNLHISQGSKAQVLFKGQKVVLENLEVTVANEELIIRLAHCFNGEEYQLDVFITVPELKQVEMAGVGDVVTTSQIAADDVTIILSGISENFVLDVQADSISTILSGKGNISYSGSSNKHKILLSGVGDVKAYNQPVKSAEVSLTGYGDVFVDVSETLKATLSGEGNVFYKGEAMVTKNETGVGKVINDN